MKYHITDVWRIGKILLCSYLSLSSDYILAVPTKKARGTISDYIYHWYRFWLISYMLTILEAHTNQSIPSISHQAPLPLTKYQPSTAPKFPKNFSPTAAETPNSNEKHPYARSRDHQSPRRHILPASSGTKRVVHTQSAHRKLPNGFLVDRRDVWLFATVMMICGQWKWEFGFVVSWRRRCYS